MPPRLAKKAVEYSESEESNNDSNSDSSETEKSPKVSKNKKTEKNTYDSSKNENTKKMEKINSSDLIVTDYTEKSFVVTGDTIPHAKKLKELGGSFNPKLKVGAGWIFSKARKESVENYIKTGEVKVYTFDKKQFENGGNNNSEVNSSKDIEKIFRALKSAFDSDGEYDGEEVLETIKKIEKKYC